MQTIVSSRIHDEIIGLIDRSKQFVFLISPFVRTWPDFDRALARAVSRGVTIMLATRGPKDGPKDHELAVFGELEIPIFEVPHLHGKGYLSERAAIHTSANLTADSLGKSIENALLYDRQGDDEGWCSVFETWQKTLDDGKRATEVECSLADALTLDLRTRAERGDEAAREDHRFCISCGSTASNDGEQIVCVKCRAKAIAKDLDPYAVSGRHCTRCNAGYARSSVERPLCDPCYRYSVERYRNRAVGWYVSGQPGSVRCWWSLAGKARIGNAIPGAVVAAVTRRWWALMPKTKWLTGTITSSLRTPLPLWTVAVPAAELPLDALDGLILERVPGTRVPECRDLAGLDAEHAAHLVYQAHKEPPKAEHWMSDDHLAVWDLPLSRHKDPRKFAAADWVLRTLLVARKSFVEGRLLDPSRSHLMLGIEIGIPKEFRARWREPVRFLLELMLASLHAFDEQEIREWLGRASPKTLVEVVAVLAGPAPFGPALMMRSPAGKIRDLPQRPDRVASITVRLKTTDEWHFRGAVLVGKKLPVN